MVTWQLYLYLYTSRCIKTFEVEFSADSIEFKRINVQDTVFTSHVYSPGKNYTNMKK